MKTRAFHSSIAAAVGLAADLPKPLVELVVEYAEVRADDLLGHRVVLVTAISTFNLRNDYTWALITEVRHVSSARFADLTSLGCEMCYIRPTAVVLCYRYTWLPVCAEGRAPLTPHS